MNSPDPVELFPRPTDAADEHWGTKPEQVADRLRDLIAEQVLEPGQRLPERQLAERLSVSRTPLREALRMLAIEGLVELSANRGAIVADPTLEEIYDLLTLLGALEALAGEQATERATDVDLSEIRALHYEMLAAFERSDRLTYYKRNQDVHLAIVAASRNAAVIETHARINARLYRVRFASNQNDERRKEAVAEHEEILRALDDRKGAEVGRLLRRHQDQAWKNLAGTA